MANEVKETKIELTEKTAAVLAWLKENDEGDQGYTPAEIAEGMGFGADNGIKVQSCITSLVKKELVEAGDPVTRPFTNKAGLTGDKQYKTYRLTEAGRAF